MAAQDRVTGYRQALQEAELPLPVTFAQLLRNSLLVAGGTAILAVAIGTTAAYAFSRIVFPGRQLGMLGFVPARPLGFRKTPRV
jgi:ABC-type glycerol-3-phosphate transport system permease component